MSAIFERLRPPIRRPDHPMSNQKGTPNEERLPFWVLTSKRAGYLVFWFMMAMFVLVEWSR